MKKYMLFCALCLASFLTLIGCKKTVAITTAEPKVSENPTIKVGLVVIDNENDQGYTYNFMQGMRDALDHLRTEGYSLELLVKRNIGEDESCRSANQDLAVSGCRMIFNNSYGFESFMQDVAKDYPAIDFIALTNSGSQKDTLSNTYNAFASIYEGRYLSGVVAGLKLEEMIQEGKILPEEAILGYVGAYSYAEVISGMTAFYLGAKRVCPTATMLVQFVGSWGNAQAEAEAAQNLIDKGAKVVSQHSDTTAPAMVAEKNGIFHAGYNNDMTGVAPHASLVSCRIDWTNYFYTFIKNTIDGKKNPSDYTGTLAEGAVVLTKLNEQIAAPNTKATLLSMETELKTKKLHVFDLSSFTIDGRMATNAELYDANASVKGNACYEGFFHESQYQSAPYFAGRIDGITWLNEAY